MMPDLSPDQLDQLEWLNEQRTPGPFEASDRVLRQLGPHSFTSVGFSHGVDAEWFAALANAAPALLAAARQLQHTEAALRGLLVLDHDTPLTSIVLNGWAHACGLHERIAVAEEALARAGEGGSSE